MTDKSNPESPEQRSIRLQHIDDQVRTRFTQAHDSREIGLRLSREIIRNSANSIRAAHRGEFPLANELLAKAAELVLEIERTLKEYPSVYYAGFVEDSQKEFVEASAMLAFAEGTRLPDLDDLNIGPAPYINGLAESVGELRRFIVDAMRRNEFTRCEELLELMDEVYSILVSMDFPDALTRGLRRTTDMVRGVLERTRSDLTLSLRQKNLEQQLELLQTKLGAQNRGDSNDADG